MDFGDATIDRRLHHGQRSRQMTVTGQWKTFDARRRRTDTIRAPDVLAWRDVPMPEPGPGQVAASFDASRPPAPSLSAAACTTRSRARTTGFKDAVAAVGRKVVRE